MQGNVAFCVGTGRCGTTFLAEVAGQEPHVAASHERLRLAATVHMYCQWHRIPVDPEGFLVDRVAAVQDDLARHEVSFESSALLSHSLEALHGRFGARFVMLVRHPAATVASFAARGWFVAPPVRGDASLPPSYREGEEPRHFFGRNLPRTSDGWAQWCDRSPVGRIAWFWSARNGDILDQFSRLPADVCRIQRLEDLDHDAYQSLAQFLGWTSTVSRTTFDALAASRPNASPHPPRTPDTWSPKEVADFESETCGLARKLGYETRVATLLERGQPVVGPLPERWSSH